MKKRLLAAVLFLSLVSVAHAEEQVTELVKGSVPSTHVSVLCVSGVKVAVVAFCGPGCGIAMTQLLGPNGKPVECK
ncbi:MAG: hypothetical protein A2508_03145 [Candidatus Lambdaproteobacteria bacterium RIFOXYD12_FULL_49_8]|uniref:Uncharacterized protein n=1 Tax=Candidatus Lambdaproteobacteria bacterium RIFOXYD2_FULL_50_16 TaxID=1817772 RepID=A0A1F6GAA2_9PROT|nr:MAG: hypothetical protein A2527_12720 [Candidatus Lambdaproteobacteria bacterium RIFOXYD2_FULL_50_16]OGG98295.1 MAG: hypothetical protein A2508_03145 [Candidatus Lambdaproteobacteria bacterium RIFOXYD12_FULL_49_8]